MSTAHWSTTINETDLDEVSGGESAAQIGCYWDRFVGASGGAVSGALVGGAALLETGPGAAVGALGGGVIGGFLGYGVADGASSDCDAWHAEQDAAMLPADSGGEPER